MIDVMVIRIGEVVVKEVVKRVGSDCAGYTGWGDYAPKAVLYLLVAKYRTLTASAATREVQPTRTVKPSNRRASNPTSRTVERQIPPPSSNPTQHQVTRPRQTPPT